VNVKPWAELFNSAMWPGSDAHDSGCVMSRVCMVATPTPWAWSRAGARRYHRSARARVDRRDDCSAREDRGGDCGRGHCPAEATNQLAAIEGVTIDAGRGGAATWRSLHRRGSEGCDSHSRLNVACLRYENRKRTLKGLDPKQLHIQDLAHSDASVADSWGRLSEVSSIR